MWSKLENFQALELIPGLLAWAPGIRRGTGHASPEEEGGTSWYIFRLLDFEEDEFLKGGEFSVPHYGPQAFGAAFGPLALDRMIAFCALLETACKEKGRVVVTSEAEDEQDRTNVAVLLGAYLLLCKSWTMAQLEAALTAEAAREYVRIWMEMRTEENPPSKLKVQHCWSAVQYALARGMLPAYKMSNPASSEVYEAFKSYRATIIQYDSAWLSPGEVVVGADPMTVICDPNKNTCCSFLPQEPKDEEELKEMKDEFSNVPSKPSATTNRASAFSTVSSNKDVTALPSTPASGAGGYQSVNSANVLTPTTPVPVGSGAMLQTPTAGSNVRFSTQTGQTGLQSVKSARGGLASVKSVKSMMSTGVASSIKRFASSAQAKGTPQAFNDSESCHTVAKEYGQLEEVQGLPPPMDFVTWCKTHGVRLIVRANHPNEPGLKEIGGSYDPEQLRSQGLEHFNAPFNDTHGAVPSGPAIGKVLEQCDAANGAVMFHCKGGFGRSVLLACCYLIHKHDIPGSALLGWARMVRPGAIITGEQEKFLIGLKGREDLRKYVSEECACCVLQ
mmetsp:Transcript_48786/g.115958  ORF Transcript_48786/g.115958 Transcript_48786/m.115958 type:complete len:560 (+) Transcript_48786:95-1774(+)